MSTSSTTENSKPSSTTEETQCTLLCLSTDFTKIFTSLFNYEDIEKLKADVESHKNNKYILLGLFISALCGMFLLYSLSPNLSAYIDNI